jgi:non-ribosomal peptide synthetase component F
MDDWRIAQMARHYVRILEEMIADLSTKLEEVEILSHEERRQLLYEGNATQREYPKDKCVHELFELQAARSPEAVAAVDEDQHLSYGELNRRANQWSGAGKSCGYIFGTISRAGGYSVGSAKNRRGIPTFRSCIS